jgi:hypothetical protein
MPNGDSIHDVRDENGATIQCHVDQEHLVLTQNADLLGRVLCDAGRAGCLHNAAAVSKAWSVEARSLVNGWTRSICIDIEVTPLAGETNAGLNLVHHKSGSRLEIPAAKPWPVMVLSPGHTQERMEQPLELVDGRVEKTGGRIFAAWSEAIPVEESYQLKPGQIRLVTGFDPQTRVFARKRRAVTITSAGLAWVGEDMVGFQVGGDYDVDLGEDMNGVRYLCSIADMQLARERHVRERAAHDDALVDAALAAK